ncbi:hypothetical protein CABS01_10970 [Colletotrichum abscissum]|uniref:uncharacterized protein n=1 Tax=Colletotrichum abscissum TaxID=1671311 RepID=UPI0027D570E8|nr:uncharacterized protein CABS01_10970 [Colletotrichum abscissum]KAK1496821.1 hypothetical protein CABS01_10970 [Colletotrichum abscissum]
MTCHAAFWAFSRVTCTTNFHTIPKRGFVAKSRFADGAILQQTGYDHLALETSATPPSNEPLPR